MNFIKAIDVEINHIYLWFKLTMFVLEIIPVEESDFLLIKVLTTNGFIGTFHLAPDDKLEKLS